MPTPWKVLQGVKSSHETGLALVFSSIVHGLLIFHFLLLVYVSKSHISVVCKIECQQ